jgi:hypothetical protein
MTTVPRRSSVHSVSGFPVVLCSFLLQDMSDTARHRASSSDEAVVLQALVSDFM